MTLIKIKLNENSVKDFLTTQSGYTITKEDFCVVDDNDVTIHSYIINRDDLIIEDFKEKKQKKVDKVVKLNEGSVKKTIKDENKEESFKEEIENEDNVETKEFMSSGFTSTK